MNLHQNPFALLELSSRDNKSVITEQFEEKISDGDVDEHDLMLAQKDLMASKTRLKAELSWLPNLNPKKATEIAGSIREKNYKKLKDALSTLDGLSRANVASFLCLEKQGTKQTLHHLFEAQSQFDTATILNDINGNRKLAGFPGVDQNLISESIPAVSAAHAEAAMAYITSAKHPGNVFTTLVEKYIDDHDIIPFINEVAEKYDSWVISKLRNYEDEIKDIVKQMKQGTSSAEAINKITILLEEWDEYSQPLQLIYQAKGLDEKRAKELYRDMRDVCLWLANENDDHELSLTFAQNLRGIFPELPSVAAQIDDDINSLEDLVEEAKADKDFADLTAKFVEAIKEPKKLCKSVTAGNFRENGKGLAGELYTEFQKAVELSKGKEHEEWPWNLMRKMAIYLNNELETPVAAQKIISVLQKSNPPSDTSVLIDNDAVTMEKNILNEEFETALRNSDISSAITALDKLISLSENEEKQELIVVRDKLKEKRKEGWVSKIVWAVIIIGGIAYFASNDSGSKKSYNNNSSSSYSSSTYDSTAEVKPSVGNNNVHSRAEIRYCHFQGERLAYIENQFPTSQYDSDSRKLANGRLLSDSIIAKYDGLIADYNSRCSSYRYRDSNLNAVKRELTTKKTALHKEAQEIMKSWNVNFRFY